MIKFSYQSIFLLSQLTVWERGCYRAHSTYVPDKIVTLSARKLQVQRKRWACRQENSSL